MPKAEKLCVKTFSPLKSYLLEMTDNCPHDYFQSGPRSSALRFKLDLDIKRIPGHEICSLAAEGLEGKRFSTAHSNVQMCMLQNDSTTISIEVPIWLNPSELPGYQELFNSDGILTGHIDALRVEDGNVWIWDYKPKSDKEKYASTQTQCYALMLSSRTGIPIEKFRCGYFDDEVAYVFKPITASSLKSKLI